MKCEISSSSGHGRQAMKEFKIDLKPEGRAEIKMMTH
jgi:hypothetical protein